MSRHLSLTLKILHFFSDYWFKNLIFNLLISLPSTRLYVNKEYQSERSNDLLIFLIKSLFQIYLHRRIQNPVKHLRWRLAKIVFLQKKLYLGCLAGLGICLCITSERKERHPYRYLGIGKRPWNTCHILCLWS